MSKIENIIIDFRDLTDDEQMCLWMELWHFVDKKLPSDKLLKIYVKITKDDKKKRAGKRV